MKYKKDRLRLNEIASVILGFDFLVKFGLVLIYISKVFRKKSSSILLRKNMFNSSLFFLKACTFSSFQRFLCWKSRNYSQQFSLEIFFWDLSSIIDYWGSIFTLYLTWGAFSLVCVVSVFFFFLSFFTGIFLDRH